MNVEGINQPIFGNWYIEEKIGAGAFGTVYKVKREDFGKEYFSALKVIRIPQDDNEIKTLRNELGDDKSVSNYYTNFVQDFAKEIEVMSALKGNSNIVSYEDHAFIQNPDGIGWTVMIRMELLIPYVDYQTRNNITTSDIVQMGIDLCSALETCEKMKIIHRDIKIENIFVSPYGKFELGDFGIARELEKTTGGLSKKGTYSYMAPEVYLGKPYNHTVDIYSLGIVLYRLLNHNRAPFMPEYPNPITFTDRENALQKRMQGAPIPDIKDIPKPLNDAVIKACAYDPKARYQSATEFKQALTDTMQTHAFSEKAETVAPKIQPKYDQSQQLNYQPASTSTEKTAGPFSGGIINSAPVQQTPPPAPKPAPQQPPQAAPFVATAPVRQPAPQTDTEKTMSAFSSAFSHTEEPESENGNVNKLSTIIVGLMSVLTAVALVLTWIRSFSFSLFFIPLAIVCGFGFCAALFDDKYRAKKKELMYLLYIINFALLFFIIGVIIALMSM